MSGRPEKLPCGCYIEVQPERGGKQTAVIDATSFLCREGHVQGQAIDYTAVVRERP